MGMGHTLYTEYAPKKTFNWSAIETKKRMKALFMAVRVRIELTERYSRSQFSKLAHLPLCHRTLNGSGQ